MLTLYSQLPASSATEVDPVASFTATAGQTLFTLPANMPATRLGGQIQSQNTKWNQLGNPAGFTKDTTANTFTLATPAPTAGIVIAPGIIRVLLKAYDQTTVSGLTNPNISSTPIYLIDSTEIANKSYVPTVGQTSILLQVIDLDSGYGASASWVQAGYAVPATGAAPTSWNTAGASINVPNIGTFSTLSSLISAGATSMTVADGTQFPISTTTGFVLLDAGTGSEEIVQLYSRSTNVLTTSPTVYSHSGGINVYFCGIKLYLLLTLPTGLGGSSMCDLATQVTFDEIDR